MAAVPPPPAPPPPAPPLSTETGISSHEANTTDIVQPHTQSSNAESSQPTQASNDKSWERVWTVKELRSKASSWQLAGDAGLLLLLKSVSEDMLSKTTALGKDIDNLAADIKTCSVNTNDAFNTFITLANTQFVENRVYDEDVNASSKQEEPAPKLEKTREQKEAELVPKISEAIKLGLSVLDTAYDQVEVDPDSEDEEGGVSDVVFHEVNDPYITRPLPYIVGTNDFLQHETIGLLETWQLPPEEDHGSLSSESETDEPPEQAITAATDSDHESEYSYSDSEDEQPRKSAAPRKVAQDSSGSEYSEDGEDLFSVPSGRQPTRTAQTESESESEEEQAQAKVGGPVDVQAELAKKLGLAPQPQKAAAEAGPSRRTESMSSAGERKSKSKKTKSKKKSAPKTDDLFGPGSSDEEDGLFSAKGGLFDSKGGLFDEPSGSGGLFDDAEVDEGLLKKRNNQFSPSSEEDSEDSEPSKPQAKNQPAKQPQTKVSAPAKKANLFDSDSEDDGGLFGDKPAKQQSAFKPAIKPTAAAEKDLFGSDSEEEEEPVKQVPPPRARTQSGRKVPAGAVPMFGSGVNNPLAAALKKRQPSSDEYDIEEENDTEESVPSTPQATITKNKPASGSDPFADEDDGDLFGSKPAKQPTPETKKKMPAGAVSMFGGAANPLAAALKQRNKRKSTSSEEEEDEEPPLSAPPSRSQAPAQTKPAPKSLFDDDDDDDDGGLFGGSSKKTAAVKDKPQPKVQPSPQSKAPVQKKSLFSDSDSDDPLFSGNKPITKPEPAVTKQPSVTKQPASATNQSTARKQTTPKTVNKPQKSLFSDSEDDGEDLFGVKTTVTKQPQKPDNTTSASKPVSNNKKDNLFGDESDDDDMFSKPAAKPPPQTKTQTSLFSEDSEDEVPVPKPTPNPLSIANQITKPAVTKAEPSRPSKVLLATSDEAGAPLEPPAKSKPLKSGGLFSSSDDDSQPLNQKNPPPKASSNLFSETDEKISGKANLMQPKVHEQTIVNKPAPSTSGGLFSDDTDDDLFGSGKPSGKPKVVLPEKSQPALFGSPSSEDDMFSSNKKVAQPTKSSANDPSGGQKGLFRDPQEMVNETNGSITSAFRTEAAVSDPLGLATGGVLIKQTPKSKRPAGAVSMFGGMDPTALLKNRKKPEGDADSVIPSSPIAQLHNPSSATIKSPSQPLPTRSRGVFESSSDSEDDLFKPRKSKKIIQTQKNDSKPSLAQKPVEDSKLTVSAVSKTEPSPKPARGKLANPLNINPAALLPGAAPPSKKVDTPTIGFDSPPSSSVLQSANKTRARIQQKRKPPSRRPRAPDAGSISAEAGPVSSETPPTEPPSTFHSLAQEDPLVSRISTEPSALPEHTSQSSGIKVNEKAEPQPKVSRVPQKGLFDDGSESENDMFSNKPPPLSEASADKTDSFVTSPSVQPAAKGLFANDEESDNDGMFGFKPNPPKTTSKDSSSEPPNKSTHDGLLRILDPLSRSPELEPIVNNVVVDPLGDEPTFGGPPPLPEEPVAQANGESLFGDDDEIFQAKLPEKKAPVEKPKPSASTIFDDDDDFFADLKPSSKSASKKAAQNLFSDDDDLFASPSKTKTSRKREVTADADLFGDDSDIFGNISATKSKPRKAAAPKKKAAPVDDDLDDLFGDLSKKPTKKTPKKTSVLLDDDDLFGPLS